MTGRASTRPVLIGGGGVDLNYVSFPFYGPWGSWYPWYGGFGWNLGFVAYNPWYYGATRWYWSPYGMWYDPYSYWAPFYGSGGYVTGGYSSGGGSNDDYTESKPRAPKKTTGSVRIKANPGTASVFVDGALVGKVEEFSGLNDKLELEGGLHTLELRAEGYVTQAHEINVKVDTTQTVRLNLKKK